MAAAFRRGETELPQKNIFKKDENHVDRRTKVTKIVCNQ
jgi:hypothetical protein